MPAESTKTDTQKDVQYLEDIDKSRRIIDNLNLLPEWCKDLNNDWGDVVDWHQDRISFYLDLLNKFYKSESKEESEL